MKSAAESTTQPDFINSWRRAIRRYPQPISSYARLAMHYDETHKA